MHFSSRVQADKILKGPLGDALGVVPSKNHNGFRLAAHEGYGLFRPAVLSLKGKAFFLKNEFVKCIDCLLSIWRLDPLSYEFQECSEYIHSFHT